MAVTSIKNPQAERFLTERRTLVAALFVALLLSILLWRLINLQIVEHDDYATRSDDNRMRLRIIAPARGLIYDRNGVILADNLPTYQLELVPEQVGNLEDTVAALAELIEIPDRDRERFYARVDRSPRFRSVALRNRLTPKEVATFEVNRQRFKGVEIRATLTRHYPLGADAAHLVGYVGSVTADDQSRLDERRYRGTQRIGRVGVEASHESLLHGDPGSKIIEANAQGRSLRELDYQRPAAGRDLYLTIDARVQQAAVKALDGRDGAVVAIAPETGEILAMVSQPAFDPEMFIDGIDYVAYAALSGDPGQPLFNRALQGQYPPGSTVKPVMALAGLFAGVTQPTHRELCIGYFLLPRHERHYRDWKRSGHGRVNMHDAIAESCDVYFYKLALDLGIDNIHAYLSGFGLGAQTGIDLQGEKPGLLPSREWKRNTREQSWFPGETLNVGIGQGFMTTTPLQLAHMTAMIATKGEGMQPHILLATQDPATGELTNRPIHPLPPVEVRDPHHWNLVIDAMEAVTHAPNGTALRTGVDSPYQIAGKTGTAQVAGLSQEDDRAPELKDVPRELRDHALFIGFAPRDFPLIAVAVIAEHSGSGGRVAAPIARQVMDAYLIESSALPLPDLDQEPAS